MPTAPVIARSDNSYDEQIGKSNLLGSASSLDQSIFLSQDLYTTNIHDAGLRIRLPGAAGIPNTYHVRVRSSSSDLNKLSGGLTQGGYQLQVRLGELDEIGGSTVQFADIRNAVNAISILGSRLIRPCWVRPRKLTATIKHARRAKTWAISCRRIAAV